MKPERRAPTSKAKPRASVAANTAKVAAKTDRRAQIVAPKREARARALVTDDVAPFRSALQRTAAEVLSELEQSLGPKLRLQLRARPYATMATAFGLGFAAGGGLKTRVGKVALFFASRYAATQLVRKGVVT